MSSAGCFVFTQSKKLAIIANQSFLFNRHIMKTKIGTKSNPLALKTPPQTSEYTMHVDEKEGKEVLVCTVGKTVLHYDIRCLNDLHAMLLAHGDWMELGSADEQKPAKEGTVEAWGRSENNPVGGWYGLKKGLRGIILRDLSVGKTGFEPATT